MAGADDMAFNAMNNATTDKADNLMVPKKKVEGLDRYGQMRPGFGDTRAKSTGQYRLDLKKQQKHLGGIERVIDKPGAKGFFQKVLPGGATGKQLNPEWLESESETRRLQHVVETRSNPNRRQKEAWEPDEQYMTKDRWKKKDQTKHWTADDQQKGRYEGLTAKDYTPSKRRSERGVAQDEKFVKRYQEGIKETIGTRFENVE